MTADELIDQVFQWAQKHVATIEEALAQANRHGCLTSASRAERAYELARAERAMEFLRNCLWHLEEMLTRGRLTL